MHPSPEITLDMTAADLLKTLSNEVDESCFEVDDISAVDPLAETQPAAKAVAVPAVDETTVEFDSLEIELSADDMNAMLETTIQSTDQAPKPAAQ